MELQYISDNAGNHAKPVIGNNASIIKGLFNEEAADKYHKYLKRVRKEWDGNIK
jgi:hypothetical protein